MTRWFPELGFELGKRPNETMSALLVPVIQKAQEIGFFETLVEGLGLRMKVCHYSHRNKIEGYFRAEQDAFGAQYLRTKDFEGEATFLWLLASTVNLLHWIQHTTLVGTPPEEVGLARLVTEAMRIPTTIIREA